MEFGGLGLLHCSLCWGKALDNRKLQSLLSEIGFSTLSDVTALACFFFTLFATQKLIHRRRSDNLKQNYLGHQWEQLSPRCGGVGFSLSHHLSAAFLVGDGRKVGEGLSWSVREYSTEQRVFLAGVHLQAHHYPWLDSLLLLTTSADGHSGTCRQWELCPSKGTWEDKATGKWY